MYGDVHRYTLSERKMRDEAMVKNLKSLRDSGLFKMVARPSGVNKL